MGLKTWWKVGVRTERPPVGMTSSSGHPGLRGLPGCGTSGAKTQTAPGKGIGHHPTRSPSPHHVRL